MKLLLTLAAAVVFAAPFAANAQVQEPILKPARPAPKAETPKTEAPKADASTTLLQVRYNAALPPAHIVVGEPDAKPKWVWVTRFVRLPNRQLPPDSLPIKAVRFESQFNGETAQVKVTVLRGNQGHEREDNVGVYHLGVNEEAIVTELESFGIEPVNLKMIETVPPVPPAPVLTNRTKAIEIVSVTSVNVPLPHFKVTIRNLSEKKVRAVKVDVSPSVTTYWAKDLDRPLLEVGGTAEEIVPANKSQKTATGYIPGVATDYSIIFRTAIFEDLSFDGEREPACVFESYVVGRRLWLKRMLPFLNQQLAAQTLSPTELKQRFLSLKFELAESEKSPGSAASPSCPNPDLLSYISPNNLSLQFIRELDRIINTRPVPPINFRAWLEAKREDYKTWLAHLN